MNRNSNIPVVDGRAFSWKDGHGATELSTIRTLGSRIWSDAADIGFYITSHKTGDKQLFLMVDETRENGDILFWEFEAYRKPGIRVTVFND